MSDNQLIELYKQLDYILDIYNGWLWQDVFRYIGSGLVSLLVWLNSFLENIVDKVITFNNFYSSDAVQSFMKTTRPIVWGVFLLALIFLGFQIMLNKVDKRNDIVLNIVLAVCMLVIIPDLMVNMGKLTDAGVNAISPKNTKLSEEMVKSNVADVLYYAQKDFSFSSSKNGTASSPPKPASKTNSEEGTTDFTNANKISTSVINYINFSEKLDLQADDGWINKEDWVKKLNDDSKKVLKNKLAATGEGKQFVVRELDGNSIPGTSFGQESYYRYHVNWGTLIFSLLVTTIALGITIIKIGRAIFDLAFHQIFGMYIAVTDLSGGQRTKKILVEIMSSFAVIFFMVLLLRLFIMYANWAGSLKGSIGGIGVLLMLIAGAWALIDAPDIVQRLLGIDAGLRNGAQALMGAYAASKIPKEGYNMAKGMVKGVKGGYDALKGKMNSIAKEKPNPIPPMVDVGNSKETATSLSNMDKLNNQMNKIPTNKGNENNMSENKNPSSDMNKDEMNNQLQSENKNKIDKMPSSTPDNERQDNNSNKPKQVPSGIQGKNTGNLDMKDMPSGMQGKDTGNLDMKDMPSGMQGKDTGNFDITDIPSGIQGKDTGNLDMKDIPSEMKDMSISSPDMKDMPSGAQDMNISDISNFDVKDMPSGVQDMATSSPNLVEEPSKASSSINSNGLTSKDGIASNSSGINKDQQGSPKITQPLNSGYSLGAGIRGARTKTQLVSPSIQRSTIEKNVAKKITHPLEKKGGID